MHKVSEVLRCDGTNGNMNTCIIKNVKQIKRMREKKRLLVLCFNFQISLAKDVVNVAY